MTQTLTVEYDELIRRAALLEEPIPNLPAFVTPTAPCALHELVQANDLLGWSVITVRDYLVGTAQREWRSLATSLRNAAKAYEQADEEGAESLNAAMTTNSTNSTAGEGMSIMCDPDPDEVYYPPVPPPKPQLQAPPTNDFKQAAYDLAAPDHAAALRDFSATWLNFKKVLLDLTNRFLPFEYWEGANAVMVESIFDQHRTWLLATGKVCADIAGQASALRTHHLWAFDEHPSVAEVMKLEEEWYHWQTYQNGIYWTPEVKAAGLKAYSDMQIISTDIRQQLSAKLDAMEVASATKPPGTYYIAPPPEPVPDDDPEDGTPDDGDPDDGNPDGELPDDGLPDDGLPDEDEDYDSVPGGSTPSTGTATPSTPTTPTIPDSPVPDISDLVSEDDLTMAPASVGVPSAGMPSMGLQPSVGAAADSAVSSATSATSQLGRDAAANLSRAMNAATSSMPGGMGMAPMGAGGAGQGQDGKGKRVDQDEQPLYEEDRAWTEAVIGNRRRKES